MPRRPIQPAPVYNGIPLGSTAPRLSPVMGPFSITGAINTAQQGQNQANAANQTRYNQGLSVLGSGMDLSRNFIGQALAASGQVGQEAYRRIGEDATDQNGKVTQSAVSRGLGDTTILDTLQAGVRRDAERARQGVDEQVAQRQIGLNLQQANNERSGAGDIASFIAARNDQGPSLSDYANLVQGAASDATGARRTGSVIRGGGIGGGSSGIGGSDSGALGAGSLSGGGFSGGGGSAGYFRTGGAVSSALAPQLNQAPGPIGSALGGTAFFGNGSSIGAPALPKTNVIPVDEGTASVMPTPPGISSALTGLQNESPLAAATREANALAIKGGRSARNYAAVSEIAKKYGVTAEQVGYL